jgi:hypothetical protein
MMLDNYENFKVVKTLMTLLEVQGHGLHNLGINGHF